MYASTLQGVGEMNEEQSASLRSIAYFDDLAGWYGAWTASRSPSFEERIRSFGKLIQRTRASAPTNLAVDLGCGNGELLEVLRSAGFRVIGIDGSGAMLRQAKARLDKTTAVDLRQELLPLRQVVMDELRGEVGLLVSSSVIEYIREDAVFLQQCRELLAPGGSALVSFANASSLYRRYERALGPRGPLRGQIIEVQQRQHSRRDVETLARAAGLDLIETVYFGTKLRPSIERFVRIRAPWLATLLLARLRRT